ncbi:hypothetical protein [Cellulomonas xylanilytica]|uniref:Membrane protein NfeD2 N-terminal transmembrane domain-containing protein n=1 Tax=Cellulomonas xylanilytica TaxID=233583 RepID=A0A510V8N5_9CELL|nr:hypothetical protein [Cellulomonas xylanilytica]GEK23238.1 hypothetical protein CXY01_37580 [Cellulomonas xylanilytica]
MLIFWVIAGVALLLLVLTVTLGDFLDGAVEAIDVTGGYLSSTVVLSFLATFGIVGGLLLATTDVSVLVASLGGVVAGALVGAGAGAATRSLTDGPTAHQITSSDYVGLAATVTTSIPAGGLGQISLVVAGQSTALAARADGPVPTGAGVTVVASLGPGVVKVATTLS